MERGRLVHPKPCKAGFLVATRNETQGTHLYGLFSPKKQMQVQEPEQRELLERTVWCWGRTGCETKPRPGQALLTFLLLQKNIRNSCPTVRNNQVSYLK